MHITKRMKKYLSAAADNKTVYKLTFNLGCFDIDNLYNAVQELNNLWLRFLMNKSNPLYKYFDGWIREIKIEKIQDTYKPYLQLIVLPKAEFGNDKIIEIRNKLRMTWFKMNLIYEIIPELDIEFYSYDFNLYLNDINDSNSITSMPELKEIFYYKKLILFYGKFKGICNIRKNRKQ